MPAGSEWPWLDDRDGARANAHQSETVPESLTVSAAPASLRIQKDRFRIRLTVSDTAPIVNAFNTRERCVSMGNIQR